MLIDTHCHVDRFRVPSRIVTECVGEKITVVAVTNLPSHYQMALPHLAGQTAVIPALGAHPLAAEQAIEELGRFNDLVNEGARFIGEVGLDFSRAGLSSKETQVKVFDEVLSSIAGKQCFLTLHSRGAEKEVLAALEKHQIKRAVFHWYSGNLSLVKEILGAGNLFSINPAMIATAKGKSLIDRIPLNCLLPETDGPYTRTAGKPNHPRTVSAVYEAIAEVKGVPIEQVRQTLSQTFLSLNDQAKKKI